MEKSIAVCHSARDQGVNPGVGAVLAAIKACKRSRDLESGRMIHRDAAKNGDLDAHPAIASSLIDMYAKCGSAMEARGVFESIRQRDVVSWNCIIQGLALNGDGDAALGYFDRFVQEGGGSDSSCRPDHVTFLAALKACSSLIERSRGRGVDSRARFLARIRDIHARAARFGELSEIFLASSLTDSYAKCGSLVDAQLVFESMDSRNAVSWTAVILGFAETGQADLALEFYAAMQEEGCDPDRVTVLAALKACASLGESSEQWRSSLGGCLRRGKQVHGQALKGGYELEKFVGNALVDMYSKCGSMEDARRVFDALRKPSVVSWSSLILGYARCGQGELSLDLYSRMRGDGYVPNAVTYLAALKACVSLAERASGDGGDSSKQVHGRESEDKVLKRKWLEIGRGIHSQAAADGLGRDLFVSNALVDMYAKCGSVEEARRVFDGMTDRDSVSWTAIIQSYVQVGESEQALRLFTRMRGEGFVADAVTFVAALKACASLGALEKGREIYKELQRAGLDRNTFVWTCLIDFFGKCGNMVEAEQVFFSVPSNHKNLVAWSAMMAGYSSQGDTDSVLDLFERMKKLRLQPDDVIFLSILSACSHAGLIDKGKYFFTVMSSEYGVSPCIQHYSCMVDLYGRTNQLNDAVALVRSMPFEPNHVIWTCLLDASQRWKNVEVGQLAFESMLKLGNVGASIYVTMANIYVTAGMLDEALRIRTMCSDSITQMHESRLLST